MKENTLSIIKKGVRDLLFSGSRKKAIVTEALTEDETAVFNEVLETHVHAIKDERKRLIVCRRFGLAGFEKDTRKLIGEWYGITGSRVLQLERKALHELFRAINPKWRTWIQ